MIKIVQVIYVAGAVLLMTSVIGCSSSGSGGSAGYYRGSSWDYDNYYRSGVNRHYRDSSNREHARSKAKSAGRGAAGGGRTGGGGRAGGGRR